MDSLKVIGGAKLKGKIKIRHSEKNIDPETGQKWS